MKKIYILLSLILLITACNKVEDKKEEKVEENQIIETEPEKIYNDNPIKLALYEYKNNSFIKIVNYEKSFEPMTDIAVFSIFYTEEDMIEGYDYKNLWNKYYNTYENIDEFKIGYEISLQLNDGTIIDETITKPKNVYDYKFSNYLYIWLYDDINQTASWYSHLEEDDYNENTIMTSIKLMQIDTSNLIKMPIKLTIFTYKNELDFNKEGKYIGESKYTITINLV